MKFYTIFGAQISEKSASPVYGKKRYIVIDLTKSLPQGLHTSESEWLELFKNMAKATSRPMTKDQVIADVYTRMSVNALPKPYLSEIATSMVTKEEISTRIGTARREGREEGRKEMTKKLLKLGIPIQQIVEASGLTEEEIRAL